MSTKKINLEDRLDLKLNLISNLNYYGNLDSKKYLTPSKKIVASTRYEALGCTSFHPATNELRSTIEIKKEFGYQGTGNEQTSYEFVRYYIDYENNGTWEDMGVTSLKVQNVQNHNGLCYGVKLKITPSVSRKCAQSPVLPNIRAILSWEIEPPTNTPDYQPIYGNVEEVRIQIAPTKLPFSIFNLGYLGNSNFFANPFINGLPYYQSSKLDELKKSYKKEANDTRLTSMSVQNINLFSLYDFSKWQTKFKVANIDLKKSVQLHKSSKFNTTYEELTCVSFNAKFSELQAHIHIKKNTGFSGDLCTSGSREYVAFYMDFGNGWRFMGTSSVNVYDVKQLPEDGLWYSTFLPVDVSKYQNEIGQNEKVKIKGILSWNTPPPANNPDYVAKWGDWEVCETELSGITIPTSQIANQPWIESIGGVDTDIIDENSGLANGPSGMANNIMAKYSPFDGRMYITGKLLNPSTNARYKIIIKEPDTEAYALQKQFTVAITRFNLSQGTQTNQSIQQRPTDSYYRYLPKTTGNIQTHVNDDILGVFSPTESGIHELYIESASGTQSETIVFMVDKDRPEVDINITIANGDCGKFTQGANVKGTFSVTNDRHLNRVRLWAAPNNNNDIAIDINNVQLSTGDTTTVSGAQITVNDTDSRLDFVRGTWGIDTANLPACGYTVHIQASDRTIVNSSSVGKSSNKVSRGFCLEE
ncbi:hypothetical protein [uncultured Kordia sp.]|uniref:hypothetical protein n=1 Tax=uncultured Kordia sp. TaxID=507699 RepID=UPI00262B6E63|nr:hypothetical protein [uncultured Kordia sp.]